MRCCQRCDLGLMNDVIIGMPGNYAFCARSPLCLRFWTHMYGSGIGSLNVYVRQGAKDAKVWGLSGDAGNNWYMAQAPIASSSPFRVRSHHRQQQYCRH